MKKHAPSLRISKSAVTQLEQKLDKMPKQLKDISHVTCDQKPG